MATYDVADRSAIVTGGGSGIGRAVALTLAANGAAVVVFDLNKDGADAVVAEIEKAGGTAVAHIGNVTDPEHAVAAVEAANKLAPLKIAVNNAGIGGPSAPIGDYPIDGWQRIMHVNLTAAFALTQACLPLLQAAEDASVVFTLDETAAAPKAFWGAYAVSKAALESMLRLFAVEHEQSDALRFNGVDPGARATGLRRKAFPADDPAAAPAEDIAGQYIHLLSRAARGTTGTVQR